jgi:hypothetical protein
MKKSKINTPVITGDKDTDASLDMERINQELPKNEIALHSVGSVLDTEVAVLYPMNKDGSADYGSAFCLEDVDKEWFEELSEDDYLTLETLGLHLEIPDIEDTMPEDEKLVFEEQFGKDNPMKKVTLNCSICKEKIDEQITKNTNTVYWTEGHNAEPINAGRCCTECNNNVVIPFRVLKSALPKLDDINDSLVKALYLSEHGSEEEFDESLEECVKISKGALGELSHLEIYKDEKK